MPDEAQPIEVVNAPVQDQVLVAIEKVPRAWATGIACALMIAIFAGIQLDSSPDAMTRWGYRDAFRIWDGACWALVTSAFVHRALWHIALNVYWTWTLGRVIEPVLGTARMFLFLMVAAFVSSATQLAIFQNPGHGASGMGYALIGFGWLARKKFPSFQTVFTNQNVFYLMTWFFICWVVFYRQIGNGAHLGGLLFGAVIAEAFFTGRWPRLARAGASVLVLASVVVSLFCPWSGTWWSVWGYKYQAKHDFELAVDAYKLSLRLTPDRPWVLKNLVRVQSEVGDEFGACTALATLRKVAPEDAAEVACEVSCPDDDAP